MMISPPQFLRDFVCAQGIFFVKYYITIAISNVDVFAYGNS